MGRPPERQGTALGVYGLGTLGQSLAVFAGPVVAASIGWQTCVPGDERDAARVGSRVRRRWPATASSAARPASVGAMLRVLRTSPVAWLLGAFYFLTFGGFVAFSIYLPTLLRTQFGLTPADAGFRAAGFVVLATAMRPVGGWLADRIGGAQVLSWVFGGVAIFALAAGVAGDGAVHGGRAAPARSLMGLGNGAVFKLVPEQFPKETGTVTGLVGALGGLGGFFPPLLLGVVPRHVRRGLARLRAAVAHRARLRYANQRVFQPADVAWRAALPGAPRAAVDRVRAGAWAALVTLTLAAAIVVGSRNLQHFDAALVGYTFATLFATFGITYRYAMWLERPPTRMYWRRGWQTFFARGWLGRNAVTLGAARAARTSPPIASSSGAGGCAGWRTG